MFLKNFLLPKGLNFIYGTNAFSRDWFERSNKFPQSIYSQVVVWLVWQLLYSTLLDNVKIFWKIWQMVYFQTYTKSGILRDDLATAIIWKMHLKKIFGKSSFVKLLQCAIRGVANNFEMLIIVTVLWKTTRDNILWMTFLFTPCKTAHIINKSHSCGSVFHFMYQKRHLVSRCKLGKSERAEMQNVLTKITCLSL